MITKGRSRGQSVIMNTLNFAEIDALLARRFLPLITGEIAHGEDCSKVGRGRTRGQNPPTTIVIGDNRPIRTRKIPRSRTAGSNKFRWHGTD